MLEHIHYQIISLYVRDYSLEYSIRHITKLLKINYSNAFKRVKELIKLNILKEKKIGKANSVSINIQNLDTIHLISYVEQSKTLMNPISDVVKEVVDIDNFACIGLFGSRVSGKARKNSDWDIFIITNKEKRRDIEKISSLFPYANIQLQVIPIGEFQESLLSTEETVVKHIVKNKQIIYNPYPFYNIIRKWEKIKYAPTQ